MEDRQFAAVVAVLSGIGTVAAAATFVGTAPLLLGIAVALGVGEGVLVYAVLLRAFAYAAEGE